MSQKQLEISAARYNEAYGSLQPNQHLELELRLNNLSNTAFRNIFENVSGTAKGKLTHAIDIYLDSVGKEQINSINTITYQNGKSVSITYSKKKRLFANMQINEPVSYRIGLALEYPADQFTPPPTSTIRFKNRVSFALSDKWRLDMTALRQQKFNAGNNKQIRTEMFPEGQTVENFLNTLPEVANNYECELEFTGKLLTIEDFAIIDRIAAIVGNENVSSEYQGFIQKIAKYIYPMSQQGQFSRAEYRLKQLTNQVLAFNRNTYYSELWPPTGYLLTDKADGQRCIVYADGDIWLILSDSLIHLKRPDGVDPLPLTIADAELTTTSVWLFDVIYINGANIAHEGLEQRITHMEEAVNLFRKLPSDLRFEVKTYTKLTETNLEESFKSTWQTKREYEMDGLIISQPDDSYVNTNSYKWKPMAMNTIDFLAVKCPEKLRGIKPYEMREGKTLYLLFVGISRAMMDKLGLAYVRHYKTIFPITDAQYHPIQFSPSAQPYAYLFYHSNPDLDRKIVELVKKTTDSEWELTKIRDDRKAEATYFGNDFKTAEITFMNYVDPFELEDLWKSPTHYFRGMAETTYVAKNKYMRYVISVLLRDNFVSDRVVDLAAGRGADLHRLAELGIKEAVFVDIDPTAIVELIRRKFSFSKQRNKWIKGGYDSNFEKTTSGMTIHTLCADLKTDYKQTVDRMRQFGIHEGIVDNVMCNFAVHYLCDDKNNLYNFFQLCAVLLKTNGLVMVTTMAGARVFDLLNDILQNQSWESREGETLKYAIKKLYNAKTLAKFGQKIAIKLPFSDEMYEEPLCNIDALVQTARKCGLEVELNDNFDKYIKQFEKVDKGLYDRLTDEDKKYIGLHQYLTFRKVKNVSF